MELRPPREAQTLGAFRPVPRTGVIYVTTEAAKRGFRPGDPAWCNLGQGQPETGEIPGAPARVTSLSFSQDEQDYAPVAGLEELREAVAAYYNHLYRKGLPSQYTAENVAICGGGRVGLMRVCAAVAPVHLGHFLPDYTAYEELLDVFRRFQPIPILLQPEEGYAFSHQALRKEILGRGLGAVLLSNPCNPTGKLLQDESLESWVQTANDLDCALIFDEFYSHYCWTSSTPVSAARFVNNVNRDAVIVVDGLTKNWRYPGWRVTWVVGPKSIIQAVASAGSFLDGGASHPMQRAAVHLLHPQNVERESAALRQCFYAKRTLLLQGLKELGVTFDIEPQGTFYAWGDLSQLPPPLNHGGTFFERALQHQTIVVPGEFFDINPGKRRLRRPSRFRHHVRFSFGPETHVIEEALNRLRALIHEANP